MRKSTYLLPLLAVVVVGFLSSIYVVDEREKALVLQFGQIRQVQTEPGIGFKIPFIQEVVKYDDRILSLDTDTIEVTPSDDRRLVVDAFARYRIADVVLFRQAVGTGGLPRAQELLQSIFNGQIREVLGADQGAGPWHRYHRCAAQADQPAQPEPRRHFRPDAGRA
jgi:modulator of FtsH protease HflC